MGLLKRIFAAIRRIFNVILRKLGFKAEHTQSFISVDGKTMYRIIRPLTDELREQIEKSTLLLRASQLYMHYWTDNLVCTDSNDQEWQNKVMFFWKAEEPFQKKSLPPDFQKLAVKHFLFTGDTSSISLQVGEVIPWFGMPGGGEKHVCAIDAKPVTVPEMNKLGVVEYVEQIELGKGNLDVLTDKDDYFFLIDERITPFINGSFQLDGKPVSISTAYEIAGIHLLKSSRLQA